MRCSGPHVNLVRKPETIIPRYGDSRKLPDYPFSSDSSACFAKIRVGRIKPSCDASYCVRVHHISIDPTPAFSFPHDMPCSNRVEYSYLLPEKSSQEEEFDYCNYANSTSTIAIDPGAVQPQRARSLRPYLAKVALGLTAAVVLLVICSVMFWAGRHWPLNLERRCLNLQSTYCGLFQPQDTNNVQLIMVLAPALKDIDSVYKPTKFNGTLDYPSIYRQAPSPEVDSAWDILELGK